VFGDKSEVMTRAEVSSRLRWPRSATRRRAWCLASIRASRRSRPRPRCQVERCLRTCEAPRAGPLILRTLWWHNSKGSLFEVADLS
jgi:hypothetical protein